MPAPLLPKQKLFFPNIIMRLLRSNLPPHQCVFRCPPQLNKIDIKQYLEKLYDIQVNDVRTMNYLGRLHRMPRSTDKIRSASYKKVIVTMEEDFVFPPLPVTKRGINDDEVPNAALKQGVHPGIGRNSANAHRHKIEPGRPKGVGGWVKKAMS
ncbi:ribosomal protein L23/L15e core domain-containing protein [Phlyctochytrium arcticum]|nr:ribosomal protein L23/L15e core domain-containing protein [Phlyctochytrium arcticum]